jgi:hypothetical protein
MNLLEDRNTTGWTLVISALVSLLLGCMDELPIRSQVPDGDRIIKLVGSDGSGEQGHLDQGGSVPVDGPVPSPGPKPTNDSGSGGAGGLCGQIDQMRTYNLQVLNTIRAGRNPPLPPYKLDSCLNNIAAAANKEWASGGSAHGKFVRECITKRPNCKCNWQQENMGASWGTNLAKNQTWKQIIERHMNNMMKEEPYNGGHFRNIVSTKWKRVGVGIVCNGIKSLHLTNDFGP